MAIAVAALTFRECSRFAPARQGAFTYAHLVGHHGLGQPLVLELRAIVIIGAENRFKDSSTTSLTV